MFTPGYKGFYLFLVLGSILVVTFLGTYLVGHSW